jgi:hypothetical protein
MNNNLFIISGITVSFLVVILLFKLNKTKIEYDNKLLVLNRKVRDLTNLVDLSNTKNSLLENVGDSNMTLEQGSTSADEQNNTQIENQFKEFVTTNENFFNNLEQFDAPIPEEVKNDIDTLVNEDDMYSNLDAYQYTEQQENKVESVVNEESNEQLVDEEPEEQVDPVVNGEPLVNSDNTQTDELPQSSVDEDGLFQNNEINLVDGVSMETVVELDQSNEITFNELNSLDVEHETINIEELDNAVNEDMDSNLNDEETSNNVDIPEDDNSNSMDYEKLDNMSVKELQELCRQNKLKIKGRKDELIERIKEHFSLTKL